VPKCLPFTICVFIWLLFSPGGMGSTLNYPFSASSLPRLLCNFVSPMISNLFIPWNVILSGFLCSRLLTTPPSSQNISYKHKESSWEENGSVL
jgi:hypothetical protein